MSEPDWSASSRDDFRNRVEVEYTDALSGERRTAVAAHHESYVALGNVWRTVEISEPAASLIDSPEKAQQFADAVLADLCFH